tara:strand:- start:38 stop:1798 length:1761 start_codon:yes stop_codon:yes gene_type:complete
MVWWQIGAALGGAILGSGGGNRSQENEVKEHQNEQTRKQYEADLANYKFQYGLEKNADGSFVQLYDDDGSKKGVLNNQYEYAVESLKLRKKADQETKAYQEETANQNWEMGKAQQDYEWLQQDRIYKQNIDNYTEQNDFNDLEYEDNLARERAVLDERVLESAFQNQGIIQDLFEATGTAGFNKVQAELGLLNRENTIEYQKQKQLTNLQQSTRSASYQTAGKELDIIQSRGLTDFQKASEYLNLAGKEVENRFAKARLNLDTKTQQQALSFQNQMLRREQNKNALDTAKQIEDQEVAALKAAGQAQLTQAGRSQGKAVSMIMAELGRHNGYLAESLIRGQDIAAARMAQNRINSLNVVQKAALAEQQIDMSTVQNIQKTMMNVEELDRGLKMSDAKSQLDLDQIKQGVFNNVENATVDVKKLEQDLLTAQTDTGINLKKIDFDLDNLGSRFKTNQDIIRSSLESAVKTTNMNMKDVYRAKRQADLLNNARRMLDPSVGRDRLDLDEFKPIELPQPIYQDPQAPEVGPPPIQGALMSPTSFGQALPGAALGGISTGLSVYNSMNGAKGGGFLGIAAGVGSMFSNLF